MTHHMRMASSEVIDSIADEWLDEGIGHAIELSFKFGGCVGESGSAVLLAIISEIIDVMMGMAVLRVTITVCFGH